MSSHPDSKRPSAIAAIAVACSFGLLGCSSEGSGDWGALIQVIGKSWDSHDHVALNEAAAIPYATLGVRIGGGPEQILTLASETDDRQLWVAGGGKIALTIRQGRIVSTAGLGADLSGYDWHGSEPWSRSRKFNWFADFADLNRYSMEVDCTDNPAARETITILGASFDVVRIVEACRNDQIGWAFENTYWVSVSTGRVWRSIQHVHPGADSLEIEILRPPLSSN